MTSDSAAPAVKRIWVIGSDPECDVTVAQDTVSGRHALVAETESGFVLDDLASTNGTFVDGYRIDGPVEVNRFNRVTLGSSAPMPWPETVKPMPVREIRIGRAPDNDVVYEFSNISNYHAKIIRNTSSIFIQDLGSTNGTYVNSRDQRVELAALSPWDWVYLGSYRIRASQLLVPHHRTPVASGPHTIQLQKDVLRIGRDPGCDVPIENPMVSWAHAEVRRSPGQMQLRDLGSMNGTYVNGERISGTVTIQPGDVIAIGSRVLQFSTDGRLRQRDYHGNLTLEVRDASIGTILAPISLTVYPSELVGIMGPSGAGKTTFLNAVNGYTQPTGKVLINGQDLYQNYDTFRMQMGYVPQEDIMHPQLRVWEALYFTARLRTDLSEGEIQKLIDQVLRDLEITDTRGKEIGSAEKKVISGGQRKRVNIGMELMSSPSLLFLDEPTSGLSSEDAENVIHLLKRLAAAGNTVLLTIHQPSLDIFKQLDSLLVIGREQPNPGRLVYFGPSHPDSLEFFNAEVCEQKRRAGHEPGPELLFKGLEGKDRPKESRRSVEQWVEKYRGSRYHAEYIAQRAGTGPQKSEKSQKSAARPVRQFNFKQIAPLTHRNLLLKWRDQTQTAIMLVQAPIFAALLVLVFRNLADPAIPFDSFPAWKEFIGKVAGTHFMMVVAAVWFGCNNAAREIVGEWAIYRRERMVSLKIPSYIASKFLVLGSLCALQCFVLLGLVGLISTLYAPFGTVYVIMLLASLVGVAIGLSVSAVARSTEAAIATLPIVLLPMILLGGGMKPLHELKAGMQEVAKIAPTRWAFEANLLVEAQQRGARYEGSVCQPYIDALDATQRELNRCAAGMGRTAPPGASGLPGRQVISDVAENHFPSDKPELPRTPWKQSAYYLLAMLAFWTIFVAVILKARDIR